MTDLDAPSRRVLEFLEHVDPQGLVSEAGRLALLVVFGPDGQYRDQLPDALRQAALGSQEAVDDLSDLLGAEAAPFIAFLASAEGQTRLVWAETRLCVRSVRAFTGPKPIKAETLVGHFPRSVIADQASDLAGKFSELSKAMTQMAKKLAKDGVDADPAAAMRRTRAIVEAALAKIGGRWPEDPLVRAELEGVLEEVVLKGTIVEAPRPSGKALLEALARPCWTPVLKKRTPQPLEPRYGGTRAWMAEGTDWPLHSDGGPMSLILQFDTDALPGDMTERLGGPGHIFQLFAPFGGTRMLPDDWDVPHPVYPFEVRRIAKDRPGQQAEQPRWRMEDGDELPVLKASVVMDWKERKDLPFDHGGPYLEAVGLAFETLEEEGRYAGDSKTVWGDKLGGWPALEQGPQLPEDWDHVIQIVGGGATGDEVAFDGHGWLVRDPDGAFRWVIVSS